MSMLTHLTLDVWRLFKIDLHLWWEIFAHCNSKNFLSVLKNGEILFFIF